MYRQLARYMVQLYEIDLDCIGSLSLNFAHLQRPLTIAAHEMLRLGGANFLSEYSTSSLRYSLLPIQDYLTTRPTN